MEVENGKALKTQSSFHVIPDILRTVIFTILIQQLKCNNAVITVKEWNESNQSNLICG